MEKNDLYFLTKRDKKIIGNGFLEIKLGFFLENDDCQKSILEKFYLYQNNQEKMEITKDEFLFYVFANTLSCMHAVRALLKEDLFYLEPLKAFMEDDFKENLLSPDWEEEEFYDRTFFDQAYEVLLTLHEILEIIDSRKHPFISEEQVRALNDEEDSEEYEDEEYNEDSEEYEDEEDTEDE